MTHMKDLQIPKRIRNQFDEEYKAFCKWARTNMTRTEFLEYMLLTAKHNRANRKLMRQLYSITPKKIGILDRSNKEKVEVQRVVNYLYCEKDKSLECHHCLFCLNDKDVIKSLHPKYVWYITRAFKPKITWPKFMGQELDFEKIIGSKSFLDDLPTSDEPALEL